MFHNQPILYIERITKSLQHEHIYGGMWLNLLYGPSWITRVLGPFLIWLLAHSPLFSRFYGYLQKLPSSRKKIKPFIEVYDVDTSEFLSSIESFNSFNDFFIRKLSPISRPINLQPGVAVMPADGRYRFYPNASTLTEIEVKGMRLDLTSLIGDKELAKQYVEGSILVARLCPSDYHRFHFPIDCFAHAPHLINGMLYSVNPLALKYNIQIFAQNKRTITELDSEDFGKVLFLEIGATNVGSICQTYNPKKQYTRGEEKGYFSFGGSALIILFPPNSIEFDADLVELSEQGYEIRCLMGQSLGKSLKA